jgi:hypothetical protein
VRNDSNHQIHQRLQRPNRSLLTGRMIATFIACAAAAGPAAGADESPRFAVVLGGVTSEGKEVLCVNGAFPQGQTVTLLSEQESNRTCLGKTGAAAHPLASDEPCTTLLDASDCAQGGKLGPYFLALVGGARHSVVLHSRRSIANPPRIETLTARVEDAVNGLLAGLARRQRPPPYDRVDKAPSEVFTFTAASEYPLFFRYPLRDAARRASDPASGALILVQNGSAAIPYDACPRDPIAFQLDGREYLFGTSRCCDCGWLADHVHALESGRLRLVFETSARSM